MSKKLKALNEFYSKIKVFYDDESKCDEVYCGQCPFGIEIELYDKEDNLCKHLMNISKSIKRTK